MRLIPWLSALSQSLLRQNVNPGNTIRRRRVLKSRVERLEDRALLSVTSSHPDLLAGPLNIQLSAASDHAYIRKLTVGLDLLIQVSADNTFSLLEGSYLDLLVTNIVITDSGANANQTVTFVSGNFGLSSLSSTGIETVELATNFNLTGGLTVTGATNSITDSGTGVLVVGGGASLSASATGDISLTSSGNNFSSVTVGAGQNVTLRDSNGIILGNSTVSGNLGGDGWGEYYRQWEHFRDQ